MSPRRSGRPCPLLLLAALAPSVIAQERPVALTGARLLVIDGPPIEPGTLVVSLDDDE